MRQVRLARAVRGDGDDAGGGEEDDTVNLEGASEPLEVEAEEDSTVYFGGASEPRVAEDEETEPMRAARRLNEVLALKRSPKPPARMTPMETAWYEELGVAPTATEEEMRFKFLEHVDDVEERLSYLLEAPEDEMPEEAYEEDEEDEDEAQEEDNTDDFEEWGKSALAVQPSRTELNIREERDAEALEVAEEFRRVSNLYQILSVPELRRIYDEGGVQALAERVPALHKGLLSPEQMIRMARGEEEPPPPPRPLQLRKEPRKLNYQRYQAANSIRQVLFRIKDVFRVKKFRNIEQLEERVGTIFTQLPEICVMGSVNSGKSSLLAHMFNAAGMRRRGYAHKSKMAGKTNGLDVFCFNRRFTIADSPGYSPKGYKKTPRGEILAHEWHDRWRPFMEYYLKNTPWCRGVILCHDIAKEPTEEDMAMAQFLKEKGIPTILVFTKDDKVDSETHRASRVKELRKKLKWPHAWPHAHYCTYAATYGQVFKNMLGTMMLGMLSALNRKDALNALKTDLAEIFWDYRDKYVPKPRGFLGAKYKKERKSRTYPDEDKVYTDEDLEEEEEEYERQERERRRQEMEAAGITRTLKHEIDERIGSQITPKERRDRWAELLQATER